MSKKFLQSLKNTGNVTLVAMSKHNNATPTVVCLSLCTELSDYAASDTLSCALSRNFAKYKQIFI